MQQRIVGESGGPVGAPARHVGSPRDPFKPEW